MSACFINDYSAYLTKIQMINVIDSTLFIRGRMPVTKYDKKIRYSNIFAKNVTMAKLSLSYCLYREARLLVPCLIVQPPLLFKIGLEWNGLSFHVVKLLGLLF